MIQRISIPSSSIQERLFSWTPQNDLFRSMTRSTGSNGHKSLRPTPRHVTLTPTKATISHKAKL